MKTKKINVKPKESESENSEAYPEPHEGDGRYIGERSEARLGEPSVSVKEAKVGKKKEGRCVIL